MDLSTLILIGIVLVIWYTIRDRKESTQSDDDKWLGL